MAHTQTSDSVNEVGNLTGTSSAIAGEQTPATDKLNTTTATTTTSSIWLDGLWRNNAGTVQLLGLCPLLAVSNSVANAFVLGVATLATLIVSNVLVSLIRHRLEPQNRILLYVLIIACLLYTSPSPRDRTRSRMPSSA